MDFSLDPKTEAFVAKTRAFMEKHVIPLELKLHEPWASLQPALNAARAAAREAGDNSIMISSFSIPACPDDMS